MAGPHAKQSLPYGRGVAITPSDSTVLEPTRAIYVGVSGDISVEGLDGVDFLLTAVPIGIIEIACTKVNATGTDATTMIALR